MGTGATGQRRPRIPEFARAISFSRLFGRRFGGAGIDTADREAEEKEDDFPKPSDNGDTEAGGGHAGQRGGENDVGAFLGPDIGGNEERHRTDQQHKINLKYWQEI